MQMKLQLEFSYKYEKIKSNQINGTNTKNPIFELCKVMQIVYRNGISYKYMMFQINEKIYPSFLLFQKICYFYLMQINNWSEPVDFSSKVL